MGQKQAGARPCGAVARPVAGLALLLAACSATIAARAEDDHGYATQPFTPQGFKLPEGEGCAAEVARWKAVQDNDYASGNIGLKVYHLIAGEIGRADAACQAGHDGAARALVHDSKRRHGYPD